MPRHTIGFQVSAVTNLEQQLAQLEEVGCAFIVAPIFPPDGSGLPIPDISLRATQWQSFVIALIDCSELDVDPRAASDSIRRQMDYSAYVGVYGVMLISPTSRSGVTQLADLINNMQCDETKYYRPRVYIQTRLDLSANLRKSGEQHPPSPDQYTDAWYLWRDLYLRLQTPTDKVSIALEFGGDLPSKEERERWAGEPVHLMILPTSCFQTNNENYPVLNTEFQQFISLITSSTASSAHYVLKGQPAIRSLTEHCQYIDHLASTLKPETSPSLIKNTEDQISHPLQPLRDNLESGTYEIFEADPVKYETYRKAILAAIIDKANEKGANLTVLVVGAGRGPLVRAVVFGAEDAKIEVTILVVEKNHNAIPTLVHLKETKWEASHAVSSVQIFNMDMRDFQTDVKADIVVSELLGSFADNELSPECLDGVYRAVKPDAISIPESYTSHIRPLMSSKLYNKVLALGDASQRVKLLEGNYVVNMTNVYYPCAPKPLFHFEHKNLAVKPADRDNRRFESLTFQSQQDYVCHGFAGYFSTVLYKCYQLSIMPATYSQGMFSWFPIFFPLTHPIPVAAGQNLTVDFWRCVDPRKVWYELGVQEPCPYPIQNPAGRSSSIGLTS